MRIEVDQIEPHTLLKEHKVIPHVGAWVFLKYF
jgi:hypothetical protein